MSPDGRSSSGLSPRQKQAKQGSKTLFVRNQLQQGNKIFTGLCYKQFLRNVHYINTILTLAKQVCPEPLNMTTFKFNILIMACPTYGATRAFARGGKFLGGRKLTQTINLLNSNNHHQSVLSKGRSFITNAGTKVAVLPKIGLPSQTQESRWIRGEVTAPIHPW